MSVLLAWNLLFVMNLAMAWALGNDNSAGDDCLWSNAVEEGVSSSSAARDRRENQRLIEILLRTEGDRLRRRRRQQQQETLLSSPDGDIDWISNGDSSFEATSTGQLQRRLALDLSTLLRRLCSLSSAKPPPQTSDEGGISANDLYRHLSKHSRYELGQRSREAEEDLKRPEKRKRPTKTSELDPTFMLMGIGRK